MASTKTLKTLWGRAASRCSICKLELVMDATETDDESLVGEACHIVAEKANGPRGTSPMPTAQRNKYKNLLLLCNVHHKQIDDQVEVFTVERLHEIKNAHELWVRTQLSFDAEAQRHDETWAGYIEEWERRLDLENWKAWTSGILCHGLPVLSQEHLHALQEIRPWLLSRVWPQTYPSLAFALTNFRLVAQDFHQVFSRHAKKIGDEWRTEKFYQQETDWSRERERQLLARFDSHVGLVQDLMLELTRAANLVCDRVREYLLPGFRLAEGILLVEGGPYSDFSFITYRVEYSPAERIDVPYPGLAEFQKVRFSRALHFGHEEDEA
jgi:hypothetical protein